MPPFRNARLEFGFGDVYISFVKKLCTACYFIGIEKTKTPQSWIIEIILGLLILINIIIQNWDTVAGLILITIIYVAICLARRKRICPKCGNTASMIPLDTPKAREIIDERQLTP